MKIHIPSFHDTLCCRGACTADAGSYTSGSGPTLASYSRMVAAIAVVVRLYTRLFLYAQLCVRRLWPDCKGACTLYHLLFISFNSMHVQCQSLRVPVSQLKAKGCAGIGKRSIFLVLLSKLLTFCSEPYSSLTQCNV